MRGKGRGMDKWSHMDEDDGNDGDADDDDYR